jgi:hypothetical protein
VSFIGAKMTSHDWKAFMPATRQDAIDGTLPEMRVTIEDKVMRLIENRVIDKIIEAAAAADPHGSNASMWTKRFITVLEKLKNC